MHMVAEGSRSKGVSAGLYCALAAAAVHAVDDRFHMTMWLRPVPEAERIAAEAAAAAAAAERRASDGEHPLWRYITAAGRPVCNSSVVAFVTS